jgi:hypothetical protein
LTSSTVQQGASAITTPVLEFVTGIYFDVSDCFHTLLIQYLKRLIEPMLLFSPLTNALSFFQGYIKRHDQYADWCPFFQPATLIS